MGLSLQTEIAGLKLKNPILSASGCFGYGEEATEFFDINQLGGMVTKSITPLPRTGHPPPKVVETASGMLNAIGLTNVGLDRFIMEKLPFLQKLSCTVIVNIAGSTVNDYTMLAGKISSLEGVDAIEVNISCPNVDSGGLEFGASPAEAAKVIRAVKKASRVPVIPKLSPNVTDIVAVAKAVEDAGADAVSLINTLVGTAIDIQTTRFKLSNRFGGLSGPAVKPVALAMVYKVASAVKIPVIGVGGISSGDDVVEFLMAGAKAVQIGTACFAEPTVFLRVIDELSTYLKKNNYQNVNDIIGAVKDG
ncbi:MAG: dihydroorotate dehydrogenase B catalytic subunit [candidate division Zixibacteria bacterium 4484_95]|nr:MAG: dihydroorotate dehydrogenase B catalytic subunit [candidate division Zixibacteria bacterium 4484_95]